jgi:2-dehydro-3-deoxyphosphogluconate aldolase / (4S)-4-hydroxy-2-oxoglutarate aldolase
MARFRRMEVLSRIEATGLVPVFYTPDIELAKGIVGACADGGAACLELTNRGDGAIDVFRALESFCKEKYPTMILGVGSVVDAPTAALYIQYGANFVVGPVLDEDTAFLCNARKIPYMPGCGSATEIHRAERLGVEICKVFPGSEVGGPSFVRSVKGPCPWTSIMPTGGVDPTRESITAWFEAGISAAGIGSKLITADILKRKDFGALAESVKKTLALIAEARVAVGR